MTTTQVAKLFNLQERNTRRILNDLKQERLLLNRREHELIWYLSKQGIRSIKADKQVKYVKNNIFHYIIRNQVYIHLKPKEWTTEKAIEWNGNKTDIIKPDAIMEYNRQIYFVEIDNTQSMKVNREKIDKYKQMKKNVNLPVILYVTISEYRQKELRALLNGLKSEVILYTDIK